MDLYRIIKQAYNFGRDNGSGRSDKNLNDFIEKPEIKKLTSANDSIILCGYFDADLSTSSATKCKCGREKWEHPKPRSF